MLYFSSLIFNEFWLKDGKDDQAQNNVCYLSEYLVVYCFTESVP